jgi:quercetin dioxygenase-like cupin family protein
MKKIVYMLCLVLLLSGAAQAADNQFVKVETLAKASKSWDGNDLPPYLKGLPEITILRISIPAGAKLETHKHPVINAGVLTRGQLTVVSEDGKKLRLRAGDSIVELVGKYHYGKNEGVEPAEIIVFYAGVRGAPITVKK